MKRIVSLVFFTLIVVSLLLISACSRTEGLPSYDMSGSQIIPQTEENDVSEIIVEAAGAETVDAEEFIIGDVVYTFDRQQVENDGIVVQTDRGVYTFLPAEWTVEMLVEYVDFMDRSIAYTYNWFEIKQNTPIPVTLDSGIREVIGLENSGGVWCAVSGVRVFQALISLPFVITHEAVHHIQGTKDFEIVEHTPLYLLEGMAEAVTYQQAVEDDLFRSIFLEDIRIAGYLDMWPILQNIILELPHIKVHPNGEIEPISLSKLRALQAIAHMELTQSIPAFDRGGFLRTISVPVNPRLTVDGFLQTYPTAASFSLFLLELGSREDYLRFYANHRLAEEIYGVDLAELIDIWMYDYLQYDLAVPQILAAWEAHFVENPQDNPLYEGD